MKAISLILSLFLSLAACTDQDESTIVEIRSTGLFSDDIKIENLEAYFGRIKNPDSSELVFLIKPDAPVNSLKSAITKSKKFKFKSVSVISL
jgi:hypothetical protein